MSSRTGVPYVRVFISLAAALLGEVAWISATAAETAQLGKRVEWKQISQLMQQVRVLVDIRCKSDLNAQLICDSSSMRTIWTFTLFGHPADPAVVQRILTTRDGKIGISRIGLWAGDERQFNQWFGAFAVLDQRQVEEWARTSGQQGD
jgi:hypothetical protein